MHHSYQPQHTCSTRIQFDLDGDVIHNVVFSGGCEGNLKAIPRLVEGLTVAQLEAACKGIHCRTLPTSCADQLCIAVRTAYDASTGA